MYSTQIYDITIFIGVRNLVILIKTFIRSTRKYFNMNIFKLVEFQALNYLVYTSTQQPNEEKKRTKITRKRKFTKLWKLLRFKLKPNG